MVFFRIQNLGFLGFLKLKIKKNNFKDTSNIKYVLKTGNPKESAGKDRTTFRLRIRHFKKKPPHPVKIYLLITNELNVHIFIVFLQSINNIPPPRPPPIIPENIFPCFRMYSRMDRAPAHLSSRQKNYFCSGA